MFVYLPMIVSELHVVPGHLVDFIVVLVIALTRGPAGARVGPAEHLPDEESRRKNVRWSAVETAVAQGALEQ